MQTNDYNWIVIWNYIIMRTFWMTPIYIYIYKKINANEKSFQEKVLYATTAEQVYNPEKN